MQQSSTLNRPRLRYKTEVRFDDSGNPHVGFGVQTRNGRATFAGSPEQIEEFAAELLAAAATARLEKIVRCYRCTAQAKQ